MRVFRENSGKVSSKRVIGVCGATLCLVMFALKFFIKAEDVDNTLLISIFGTCCGLLASTVMPKMFNKNNNQG